jgi:two-component system CheB/CheR fusion protein
MAFVIVQHLDPTHESLLSALLQRVTTMPVLQAGDGMAAVPNRIYVIPPNSFMSIANRVLALSARPPLPAPNLPIDHFFQALADDIKSAAIGVVLSGTGSDGTEGLIAIKSEGGISFAQDPESAQYGGMPSSAVAAGCVDFILPPMDIAAELARINVHPYFQTLPSGGTSQPADAGDAAFHKICILLRAATGVDFHLYKQSTIMRRVARRMAVQKTGAIEQYIQLLLQDPAERTALYEDIFIHVTGFFRDPEVFGALQDSVIGKIVSRTPSQGSIRVWVPGCSTGEEAYSVAMLLFEKLGGRTDQVRVQVFGTDIADRALEHARAGIYGSSSISAVSPERQRRFFTKVEGGYQVDKSLRSACVFARHDLGKDPPFSKLDLISCRNLLIYLGPVLQKKVMQTFHFALNEHGYLLLGRSESPSAAADLFSVEDPKHKIFLRRRIAGLPRFGFDAVEYPDPPRASTVAFDVHSEAERALLELYAPAAIVADSKFQIVHFQGDTSPFLAQPTGAPSLHLLKMLRPDLLVDVRTAIQQARKKKAAVRREGVRFRRDGAWKTVDIHVTPLNGRRRDDFDFLVVFQETAEAPPGSAEGKAARPMGEPAAGSGEKRLRRDLASMREQLRETIQDYEGASAGMQALQEGLLSGNEELQSANEELQTAQEELQASNEELTTLNEELQSRNAELSHLTDDLSNLLVGVNIPIVILDRELRIRRFTPAAGKVMHLIAADVGRPLADMAPVLDVPDWRALASTVVEQAASEELEVRDSRRPAGTRCASARTGPGAPGSMVS